MGSRGLIVHEWIERQGGAEKVLDQMVDTFPEAEILCLWDGTRGERYPSRTVRETWLARSPLRRSKMLALPAMPATWRNQPAADYDWVLISSHLFAHHVSLAGARDVPKIAYVHTPARYIWAPGYDPRGRTLAARAAAPLLKPLDRRRARELTTVVANSAFVRDRIRQAWGVDAEVLHPPVDVEGIQAVASWADELDGGDAEILESLPQGFVLGASRLVEYKRLDLVIQAADHADLPVVIAGSGPDESRLRAIAESVRVPVHFAPAPSTSLLRTLYQRASVFVFPPVEDFGIMPVEAMAAGTPVVVAPEGGSRESVEAVGGGVVAESQSAEALADAIRAADHISVPVGSSAADIFGRGTFSARLSTLIAELS